MSGAMGFYVYTSDNGTDYKIKMDASNAAELGATAATNEPWYPRGWVPRYVLGESAAGNRRRVTCPDPANAVWLGTDNVIALQEAGVAGTVNYNVTGRIGEKRTSRG